MLLRKLALTALTVLTLGFSSLPASADHEATIGNPCYAKAAQMPGTIQGADGWCIPPEIGVLDPAINSELDMYAHHMERGFSMMKESNYSENLIVFMELAKEHFTKAAEILSTLTPGKTQDDKVRLFVAYTEAERAAKAANNAIYAANHGGNAYIEWAKVSGDTSILGGWD